MLDRYDVYDIDKERDLQKNRPVTMEDGSRYFIRQMDPHGFWVIKPEKGKSPKDFDTMYTDFDKAYAALKVYANVKGKRVKMIDRGYVTVAEDNLTPLS